MPDKVTPDLLFVLSDKVGSDTAYILAHEALH